MHPFNSLAQVVAEAAIVAVTSSTASVVSSVEPQCRHIPLLHLPVHKKQQVEAKRLGAPLVCPEPAGSAVPSVTSSTASMVTIIASVASVASSMVSVASFVP